MRFVNITIAILFFISNPTFAWDDPTIDTQAIIENWSANEEQDIIVLMPDTSRILNPINIDQDYWNRLTDDPAFNYNEPKRTTTRNSFFDWLLKFASKYGYIIAWITLLSVVSIIFYFIIRKIKKVQKNSKKLFRAQTIQKSETEEDVAIAIEKALLSAEYPIAIIRIYQHTLILLKQHQIISINKDTTNREILAKCKGLPYFNEIRAIVQYFEKIKFGKHKIDLHQFDLYYQSYQALLQTIQKRSEDK